jgi:hypothetical protein
MNFKNENIKEEKINSDKKNKLDKFLSKNINKKDKQSNVRKFENFSVNNNNLIKFINSPNNQNINNKPISFINNNFNIINTPNLKNKIELKLYPDTDIKKISFNQNIFPHKIYKNENNKISLIKTISDNDIEINNNNYYEYNAPNTAKKYTIYSKENKEKSELNDNFMNFNNHQYLYINNSKEKNKNKNIKYKIKKNIKNNNYIDESENKKQNNQNLYLNSDNKNNMIYVNSLNERIEKIKETLQSLNVYDIISEEFSLQSGKNGELNNNDYYEKAKKLNKEFYDNLDINHDEIENILNNL